mgnify:CR=1 FL=1
MGKSLFQIETQQAQVGDQEWRVIVSRVVGGADKSLVFPTLGDAITAIFTALQNGRFVRMEGALTPLPEAALPYRIVAPMLSGSSDAQAA